MFLRAGRCSNVAISVNGFHTSSATYLNQYWRQRKGLIANPSKYGLMVTLPDYSFKDNRPTPYGSKQLGRMKKHQEYAKRVLQLIGEIDHAVDRHARLMKEEKDKKDQILANKLKPKGQQLLTSE